MVVHSNGCLFFCEDIEKIKGMLGEKSWDFDGIFSAKFSSKIEDVQFGAVGLQIFIHQFLVTEISL